MNGAPFCYEYFFNSWNHIGQSALDRLLAVTLFADIQLAAVGAFTDIEQLDPCASTDWTGSSTAGRQPPECFAAFVLGHEYSHLHS